MTDNTPDESQAYIGLILVTFTIAFASYAWYSITNAAVLDLTFVLFGLVFGMAMYAIGVTVSRYYHITRETREESGKIVEESTAGTGDGGIDIGHMLFFHDDKPPAIELGKKENDNIVITIDDGGLSIREKKGMDAYWKDKQERQAEEYEEYEYKEMSREEFAKQIQKMLMRKPYDVREK